MNRMVLVIFLVCAAVGCRGSADEATTSPEAAQFLIDCTVGKKTSRVLQDQCIKMLQDEVGALDAEAQRLLGEKLELQVLVDNDCIKPLPTFNPSDPLPPEDPVENDKSVKECMDEVYTDVAPRLNDLAKAGMSPQQIAEYELQARAKIAWDHYVRDIYCGSAVLLKYTRATPEKRKALFPKSTYAQEAAVAKQLIYATDWLDFKAAVATYQYDLPKDAFCEGLPSCPRERSAIILELVRDLRIFEVKPNDLHPPMTHEQIAKLWKDANWALFKKRTSSIFGSSDDLAVRKQLCANERAASLADPERRMPPTGLEPSLVHTVGCEEFKDGAFPW